MKKRYLSFVLPVLFSFTLIGCTHETAGVVGGGAVGAAVGAAVTGGSPVGTAVGAVGGAVAGAAIVRANDRYYDDDYYYAY